MTGGRPYAGARPQPETVARGRTRRALALLRLVNLQRDCKITRCRIYRLADPAVPVRWDSIPVV